MYTAKAGVWVGEGRQLLWQRLCEQGQFVDLLPQVSQAQKLTAHTWHWELGKGMGSCIVVCELQPYSKISWHSVEGLLTSGQVRLERKEGRLYLEVELKTFPVWSLGEILSRTDSPAILLGRRLRQFAKQYAGHGRVDISAVTTTPHMRLVKQPTAKGADF